MIPYPNIDPVAFSIGSLKIRWYGIAYVLGILGAWGACIYATRHKLSKVPENFLSEFLPWATVGIVVGGRLGHVLLYEPEYYLQHPLEILMIWHPGMSFHGGLLGVVVAALILTKYRHIKFLELADLLSIGAPIGLFFGRLANFINSELWGRHSELSWAMVFPGAGPYPRHPSQLYEALLEGPLLLILQFLILKFKSTHRPQASGLAGGSFIFFYGLFRFIVEYVRDPIDGYIGPFTAGQFYSLPLILVGLFFVVRALNQKLPPQNSSKATKT